MKVQRKRAMTSEKASQVKKQGHLDAKEFAKLIGLEDDYQNDAKAKKDVIDKNGDAHSLKSGNGYWQIFLYGKQRFELDTAFKAMNGIGKIMLDCVNSIPDSKDEYKENKAYYKTEIARQMVLLQEKLQEQYRLDAFLRKSIFEGSQVSYLTIKHNSKFHIFWHDDVIKIFTKHFIVANSVGNQKVIFKLKNNCGEIEMRNGEAHHHKEMKFRLHKIPITELLINNITEKQDLFEGKVVAYGYAIKKFCKK
jgi:hypothetical protein